MDEKQFDESFRAMLLMVSLVLVATVGFVLSNRGIDRGIQAQAEIAALPSAWATPIDASVISPLVVATPTPTCKPSATAKVMVALASPETIVLATATSTAANAVTLVPSATMTVTPMPITPTATNTPVPATPTATDTPVPTPTKVLFTLRTDLPAMTLPDWPRPVGDNGWGMHFVINAYPSDEEISVNIQRLLDMHIKWAVVIYGDEIQLQKLAPRFRDAGIMVVWRRMLRPYERYYDWARDINILQQLGVAPYMQVYNEPEVSAEWPDGQSNQALFMDNLVYACQNIYDAGGYVGLQFASESWLRAAIAEIKARGGEALFGRMFFIPHSYGMNHPPNYTEDINAVLSFRIYADIFRNEIGFVPPMIVGEGGWKYGATDDARFPKVSDELHRDYYVALYDWFRTGVLSNGEPLPDYLFAFCPWLIAHKMDDNAFYDSFAGDRVMTIEAIKAIPPFERHFSWQQ